MSYLTKPNLNKEYGEAGGRRGEEDGEEEDEKDKNLLENVGDFMHIFQNFFK